MSDRIILGVDPGTTIMGYGLIRCEGKKMILLNHGTLMLSKYKDNMMKLKHILDRSLELIENWKPDELAIESQFHGKNVQSMLKLGRAQGISIAAALYKDVPVFEYAPKSIKQAITGNGNASKEQVAAMLERLLGLTEPTRYLDATDGLAVAVTHFFHTSNPSAQSRASNSSWSSFIKDNPDRISK
jgi:crossover junction endodeoxyribonuclease RuvC